MGKSYCAKCNKIIGNSSSYNYNGKWYCSDCWDIARQNDIQKQCDEMWSNDYKPKPGEIKCPECGLWFIPRNIIIKSYVECPYCFSKIPQR